MNNPTVIIVASDCGNFQEEISLDEAKVQFECGVITREQWVWSPQIEDWEPARVFFEKLRQHTKKASQRLMSVIEQTHRRAASFRQSVQQSEKPSGSSGKNWLGGLFG